MKPLKTANYLTESSFTILFRNIELLYTMHYELYKALLDEARKPEKQQQIGKIFSERADALVREYTKFCGTASISVADSTISSLEAHPGFSSLMEVAISCISFLYFLFNFL